MIKGRGCREDVEGKGDDKGKGVVGKMWEGQLGQSNGSITDGPAECDNCPSTVGQRNGLSFQEFTIGNDWAKTLNLAMRHGWATTNRAPLGMDWPTFAGL